MKKLFVILISFAVSVPLVVAATFSDVPESHRYYAAIESLVNLKIINGYPDGTFKPGGDVVRAEALKMMLLSAGIQADTSVTDSGFNDVAPSDWFSIYTAKGKQLGIVKGQGDTGNFTPAQKVNKAEFLKMLLQSFGEDISKHQNLTAGVSVDTFPGQWFLPYFSYAKSIGIIYPTIDDKLEPDKQLTRAECADIIYKLLLIKRGGDAQKMLNLTESNLVDILINLRNNDIANALQNANDAVFYSQKAVDVASDQGIVRAANKIALGFQSLCFAYKAGLDGDGPALTNYANEAKSLAGDAYADDPSTQSLGKKIKEQADILLAQVSG